MPLAESGAVCVEVAGASRRLGEGPQRSEADWLMMVSGCVRPWDCQDDVLSLAVVDLWTGSVMSTARGGLR